MKKIFIIVMLTFIITSQAQAQTLEKSIVEIRLGVGHASYATEDELNVEDVSGAKFGVQLRATNKPSMSNSFFFGAGLGIYTDTATDKACASVITDRDCVEVSSQFSLDFFVTAGFELTQDTRLYTNIGLAVNQGMIEITSRNFESHNKQFHTGSMVGGGISTRVGRHLSLYFEGGAAFLEKQEYFDGVLEIGSLTQTNVLAGIAYHF
ncbi:MAG: outer membrane beta-barrel protein [Alphaproteobacteria bacterium GM202ARS2]|nr:outer membrane beta-barrel protein [Alphaproteobacteria bacterium GM202ARS2]